MTTNSNSKKQSDVDRLVGQAQKDAEVLAVILFGSAANGTAHRDSDTDVCLVLVPSAYPPKQLSEKKLSYLRNFDLDVHIFQQLPLYIRKRVLKEGRILFCRDEEKLYDTAFTFIREFADFEHIYRELLEETAHG